MKLYELATQSLLEGGNIFKFSDGSPKTQRIKLEDIPATLDWLETVTGLDMHSNTLGSVGKKASSGDLDIVVDSAKIGKQQLAQKLKTWAQKSGFDPTEFVKAAAEIHFLTPIRGEPSRGYVQTDFFVESDPQWIKFSMSSPGEGSSYSGAERNQLISSLAKAQGLKYSWKNGLVQRHDDTLISKDPDVIAAKVLGPKYTANSLDSVENIQKSIQGNDVLKTHLQKLLQALNGPTLFDPRTGEPVMDPRTGEPKKKPPGEFRKTQEEAARITKLTGVSA